MLSHYIAASSYLSEHSQDEATTITKISGNIIELGAGIGLPSLLASQFTNVSKVVITDGNEVVMDLVKQNIQLQQQNDENGELSNYKNSKLSSEVLIWGNKTQLKNILNEKFREEKEGVIDVVLAADVIQWPAVVEPFLHTVKALLWKKAMSILDLLLELEKEDQQEEKLLNKRNLILHNQPKCILGVVKRAESTFTLFRTLLKEEFGFCLTKVNHEEVLLRQQKLQQTNTNSMTNDLALPECCQEFGGRKTEIYEMTFDYDVMIAQKKKSILEVPVLLSSDSDINCINQGKTGKEELSKDENKASDDIDLTLGKNYQDTYFVPY